MLGWIRDLPDFRDHLLAVAPPPPEGFPAAFRMSPTFHYDQGSLGSCTANAVGALFEMTQIEQEPGKPPVTPSRLALYYRTRSDQGTVAYDSGATIRGTIKAARAHGVCKEASWPYDIKKFKRPPSAKAAAEEAAHKLTQTAYARVMQTEAAIKACLLAGNPAAFGFTVYESFMSQVVAKTGVMPIPQANEKVVGGHAVLAIGWDDAKGALLVKNSWGLGWGESGNFWMPYAYALSGSHASDFWTIYKVPGL